MMMDSSRQQQLQYPWKWRPVNMSRRHVSKLQCHSHPVGGFSAETLQQASLESKACNSKQFLQLSLYSMSNLFILGWIARNLRQAFKLLYVSLFIAASSKFSVVLQVLLQRSFQLFLSAQTLFLYCRKWLDHWPVVIETSDRWMQSPDIRPGQERY